MSKNGKFCTSFAYYILVLVQALIGGVGTCTKKINVTIIAIILVANKEKTDAVLILLSLFYQFYLH